VSIDERDYKKDKAYKWRLKYESSNLGNYELLYPPGNKAQLSSVSFRIFLIGYSMNDIWRKQRRI
jgi:hypothetical protein